MKISLTRGFYECFGKLVSVKNYALELSNQFRTKNEEILTRLNFEIIQIRESEMMTMSDDFSSIKKLRWQPLIYSKMALVSY